MLVEYKQRARMRAHTQVQVLTFWRALIQLRLSVLQRHQQRTLER